MKSQSAVSTFHYHACAHAFSGRFTRPFDHLIDVQAASSLPVIGGHGNSRIENFQFREFVFADAAQNNLCAIMGNDMFQVIG